jgi:CheY-like chemotaxis protein
MSTEPAPPADELKDNTILVLTEEGIRDLSEPGTTLSAGQLEVLILMDGHSTLRQLAKRARSAAQADLKENLRELIGRGLVRIATGPDGNFIDPGDFFTLKTPARLPTAEQSVAALAEADTVFLRQNGYCVNLARRGAQRQRPLDKNLTVLIVDDDPDIGALLRKYLRLEGLDTRMAATPEEIEAAFRRAPLPDLMLLDVQLGEIEGFHVLAKMREHPVLKKLPVIMLTGTANREVVLKGILGGADGHVTKPFLIHPMVRAVKAVLGLDYDPDEQDWDLSL